MATLASKLRCSPLWLAIALLLLLQQPSCEGRYLPTRSHGDELDKLRELMLQILESSNEEQQQPLRPPNEANGNPMLQRQPPSSWLNKLSPLEAAEAQRRQFVSGARGPYDGVRYY